MELHGDGRIPAIDLRAYAYYMTQASQKQAHERLKKLGLDSPLDVPPTSLVAGYPLTPRTHREFTGFSQMTHRGPTEDSPWTHRGATDHLRRLIEYSQSIRRGVTEQHPEDS